MSAFSAMGAMLVLLIKTAGKAEPMPLPLGRCIFAVVNKFAGFFQLLA